MDANAGTEPQNNKENKLALFCDVVKRRNYWVIGLPAGFLSLTLTGMFFYQYLLAQENQWPIQWYAACFAGFGIAKLLFYMFGGVLIDRFTAKKLFPFFLIPSILGFLILAFVTHRISPLLFLPLIGITVGLSGVITSAAIAEIYGVANIGRVRSFFTVLTVIAAAAGPVSYGVLLDAGWSFGLIALASCIILVLISLNNTQLKQA